MIKANTKAILRIALPLILQQLCLQMQVWIDRAMLGHVDSAYFSAVGNTLVPYYAITNIINALCGGTTILIAQSIGAKQFQRMKTFAENSFVGHTAVSVAAFLFFFFFSEPLFRLMGVQEPVLGYSLAYVQVLSFTLLLLGPMGTATAVLQGVGLTRPIMICGVTANLINILLDWVLIFGKFCLPAMGIRGAALATALSNFLTAPFLIAYVLRCERLPMPIRLPKRFDRKAYAQVLRVGVPSAAETGLWNVGNTIVVSFLNRLDMMSAGIYTLVFSIETLPVMFYMGFANAGLTLVGQQTGGQNHKQATRTGFSCLRFALIICFVIALILWFFPSQILGIFSSDPSLIEASVPLLRLVAFILFPKAVNEVIGLGIRGRGDTRWMLMTQIFGSVLVVSLAYVLLLEVRMGLIGIFITLFIDELLRGTMNLIHFSREKTVKVL